MLSDRSAAAAVRDAKLHTSTSWRVSERLIGGAQSGAWKLISADGSTAVLKLARGREWANQVLKADRAVDQIRAAGYPTPAWLTTGITPEGVGYQIQQLVPGRALETIGVDEAYELIRVLELQTGLDPDPDRCWSDFLAQELSSGLDDLRSGAAQTGESGRALIAACGRLLDSDPGRCRFPRTDMVHGDFRPANILFDHGQVSGVIDIEAIGSGTRAFDYATLLDCPAIDPDALELLVQAASDSAGPAVVRACFSRVALDLARFVHTAPIPLTSEQRSDRIRALTERAKDVEQLTHA